MSHATAQPKLESAAPAPRQKQPATTAILTIFFGFCAITVVNHYGHFWLIKPWHNAAFVMLAFAASVAAFGPTLAWPNVLLAGGLASAIAGMTQAINAVSGLPFGEIQYSGSAGPRPLGLIPWWLPIVWAAIALAARGAARLFLHRSCRNPRHGYHVIALATGLALLSTTGLQMSGSRAEKLWICDPTGWVPFSSLLLHLFIQVAITPLLIDKHPGPRPPNFRPLLVWISLNTLPLLTLWHAKYWFEGGILAFGICGATIAAVFQVPRTSDSTDEG